MQAQPGSEHTDAADAAPPAPTSPSDLDQQRRTSMAAERTWLAWWRTALGATAGALAVGRLRPATARRCPMAVTLCRSAAATRLSRSGSRSSAHNANARWSMRCGPMATYRSGSAPSRCLRVGGVVVAVDEPSSSWSARILTPALRPRSSWRLATADLSRRSGSGGPRRQAGRSGRYWARTSDPLLVKQVLSQLS